ncbi:MAG: hypothetical protein H6512_06605 [Acidimicrobiia bacterium]|nr:hypothetical protein [Acidimicrobiia bacterium]
MRKNRHDGVVGRRMKPPCEFAIPKTGTLEHITHRPFDARQVHRHTGLGKIPKVSPSIEMPLVSMSLIPGASRMSTPRLRAARHVR